MESIGSNETSPPTPPPYYAWADPRYALAQVAGVACNANLLGALSGTGTAETTGEDNLRTLELVFGAYESAAVTVVAAEDTRHTGRLLDTLDELGLRDKTIRCDPKAANGGAATTLVMVARLSPLSYTSSPF